MNRALPPERRAEGLIKQMTLDEKITMMHGAAPCLENWTPKCPMPVKGYIGYVPPVKRLGIPALTLADGRAGVGNQARDVTLLPAPIAAASSWDPSLLNEYGRILGQEQWGKGTNIALGPTIDVVRVPEWGRTFESYGEDPYFNGQMAAAEIKGIQSQGPIADANMYLTMNQESNRFQENSIVDERTLQEIYLPPFESAIEDGHVGTIMCAYVKTNGQYSCESAHLLTDILRDEFKFDGWVMSDWGATHSTIASVNNGLDQEMPDGQYYGPALRNAVLAGQVSMRAIDEHVLRILATMFRFGLFDKAPAGTWTSYVRSPEHDAFARKAAEEGTVLLKNQSNLLPLRSDLSVAVIGSAGDAAPKAEGGGSSTVIAPYTVTPLSGIRKRAGAGARITYAEGRNPSAASKAAADAGVAIVFAHTDETEGADRPNLELPDNQDRLIDAVAAANKRTIVVLDTGGPVLMPWAGRVAGIIEAWYPGQEDGNAIAAVLYGDFDPSGKLSLTFPRTATSVPTASQDQWPGVGGRSNYSERLNVGYRWYDATQTDPLFPFGFGLSYTSFQLHHLAISGSAPGVASGAIDRGVRVTLDVTNTGKREGAEVVQVYVGQPAENREPPHQLRGFAKVELAPGETKAVDIQLNERSFSIFDLLRHRWIVPAGTYEIFAGTSSRNLPLRCSITIGQRAKDPTAASMYFYNPECHSPTE